MFYDNLKDICKKHNTSPTQVLKDIAISTGSLGNWKKGVLPNGEIILKLSAHLNVSTDYLLLGKESTSIHTTQDLIKNKLTFDEKSLINTYRDLDDEGKTEILDISKRVWADHRLETKTEQPLGKFSTSQNVKSVG